MKKILFLLSILILQPAFGNYYSNLAREQIAREEARDKEIKIQARAEELRRQDTENILFFLKGVGSVFLGLTKGIAYTIKGAARSIYSPSKIGKGWKKGDGEIIAGSLALGAGTIGLIMYSIDKLNKN